MPKYLTISALVLATAASMSASAVAGERYHHRHHRHQPPVEHEGYVPASDDILYQLFGGPRYYDQQLFTTAS
ncbi:hypothetical protein EN834_36005, partial [bacterium M00.F.Ca.ET.191.01.1.1]